MFSSTVPFLILAIFFVLVHAPNAHAQRGNADTRWRGQSIDDMIARFMAENDIPGISLAIVQAPYIPRVVGYGLSDTQTRLLVGTNTVFDIGQMAHAYTGVALMQLVERGKLGLEDPLGTYLPDAPERWRVVPVRALLAHASGIPEDGDPAKPLAFSPYSRVAQSAEDTRLLVRVVEAASGESYRDFVRKNQFERLGLTHTFFAEDASSRLYSEDVPRNNNRHKDFLADPRLINPTERATGYGAEPSAHPAPDAILASAMDISLWDVGLAGSILVKDPALRAILYAPLLQPGEAGERVAPVMGAWRFPGRKGLLYVTGSSNGQSAFLSRFTDPSELVCVTLLANREGVDFTQLARQIAGAFDPRLGPPDAPGLRLQQSPWPVDETLSRFAAALRSLGCAVQPLAGVAPGKGTSRPETGRAGETGGEATNPGAASSQRQDSSQRLTFTFPDSGPQGKALQAVVWEEDGQVWLGSTDPLASSEKQSNGEGATPSAYVLDGEGLALRRVVDRLLLQAVTPY